MRADARTMMQSASRDDGNGCRPLDLERLAALVPPQRCGADLAFLEATQRPQGWAVQEQPWPGESLPDVPRSDVLRTQDPIVPPARLRAMAARPGTRPIEIASEHAAIALGPRELAAALVG